MKGEKVEGWISLHRQLLEWEWYQDGNVVRLWIHLLLLANHKENIWKGQLIKRGQVVTSSLHLANELRLSRQQIRTALDKLKSTNNLTIKSTNKFLLISIENYGKFQDVQIKDNQQNNQQHNKQITTNNNDNNIFIYFINRYKSNDKNFGDYMKRNKEMREDEKWELLTSEEQMKLTGMI